MTNTYNTGNALGSTDPRDLLDNASNLDDGMNSVLPTFVDRLGVARDTWSGQEAQFNLAQVGRETEFNADQAARDAEFQAFLNASGYVSLGNYASGINFTAYNQYMARAGFFYRPAPSSVPFTTTGTWVGADESLFVLLSADDVLRQDLGAGTVMVSGLVSAGAFSLPPSPGDAKPAIDAALAATTGPVHVPAGSYTYNGLLDKEDIYRLQGDGVISYGGGQIDLRQRKISPFPLLYRTVSVNLDDRDFSADWQYWIDHLKLQGADIVLVLVTNMPDGNTGNTFERLPEAKITGFIELAQANGVRIVMLKPHIVTGWDDSFSRSNVLPSNEALHMSNWGIELDYYGGICDDYGIPFLCMTVEQPNQSKASLYTTWQAITGTLRTNHAGLQLTAAYTLNETKSNLGFAAAGQSCQADLLDVYGQNVYPSYTDKVYAEVAGVPNITVDDVKRSMFTSSWGYNYVDPTGTADYFPKMQQAYAVFGKPVFVTEVGCMNRTDALIAVAPIIADVLTYKTQELLIRAAMQVFAASEMVVGISWWNVLGPFDYFNNSTVTEAEQAMIDYYKGGLV